MSDPSAKAKKPAAVTLQILFVVWLIAINALYYAQFKAMFLARFGSLVRR